MNYEEIAKERINYHYADFLRDCRHHNIHADISRAIWNLSRDLMYCYYEIDYRPFLMDNLEKDFDVDDDDITDFIIYEACDGLGLKIKDEKNLPYISEYPTDSIIFFLDHLNHCYEGGDE
ncbi:MAG: hypothetical protein ACRCXK_13365 [Wohlfahrtiimonas sp.]